MTRTFTTVTSDITADLIPAEWAMFVVQIEEQYEQSKQELMTVSRAKAVAAFNSLCYVKLYADTIALVGFVLVDEDYVFAGKIEREATRHPVMFDGAEV